MKQIITASLITLFLLPILFLSGCDKKQQKISKTEKAGSSVSHTFKPKTDLSSSQEKQLKKESASFENIKKDSESFADKIKGFFDLGSPYVMTSNTIDNVEEFVKSRTNKELLDFLRGAGLSEPYAAKQIAKYILKHTTNSLFYTKVAEDYIFSVINIGTEEDESLVTQTFNKLIDIHETESIKTWQDREENINTLNTFATILNDPQLTMFFIESVRRNADSDLELSMADCFEHIVKRIENTPKSITEARALLNKALNRNVFGRTYTKKYFETELKYLENFPKENVNYEKGFHVGNLKNALNKTPEEIMHELAEAKLKASAGKGSAE